MDEENTEAHDDQEPEAAEEGSAVPDPERDDGGDGEDVPEAD